MFQVGGSGGVYFSSAHHLGFLLHKTMGCQLCSELSFQLWSGNQTRSPGERSERPLQGALVKILLLSSFKGSIFLLELLQVMSTRVQLHWNSRDSSAINNSAGLLPLSRGVVRYAIRAL